MGFVRTPPSSLLGRAIMSGSGSSLLGETVCRRVFYSFHYTASDVWRASQIRQIGAIEGNRPCTPNEWEEVRRKGDDAIKNWIGKQMDGRTCAVVLIGAETATRPWVTYEIIEAWKRKMGVLGVYIHNLHSPHDPYGVCAKGASPFVNVALDGGRGKNFTQIIPVADPVGATTQQVYASIKDNLNSWIETAINTRNSYP